jgi:hypothetical protein
MTEASEPPAPPTPDPRPRRQGEGSRENQGFSREQIHGRQPWIDTTMGIIKIATMLVILIIGLIAGPAVSL